MTAHEISRSFLTVILSLAAGMFLSAPASAARGEVEEDHELSMEFETAHTDWAQPYALGKVRVLNFRLVSPGHWIKARDLIELMQRFDVEAETVYYRNWREDTWHGREAGLERILRLLEKPWDCFVFNEVKPSLLPTEAQVKLLEAVTEGTGLVLISVGDDSRIVNPENRITELPTFLANVPDGKAYRIKQGRAIRMSERPVVWWGGGFDPQVVYRRGWQVEYDYWLEHFGRAVLWAAKRSPRVDLTIDLEGERIDRADGPGMTVKVAWTGSDAPPTLTVEARLRRSDGTVIDLEPPRQAAAKSPALFRLARHVPAGQYHVEAFASSNKGVEAWTKAPIEIRASRRVEALELDKQWAEIGETLSGSVKLAGDPLPGEKLTVQLLDDRRRILVHVERPVTDSTTPFEFTVEEWMPMLLEVRALLADGNGEVSSQYTYVRVPQRHRGRFNFVVWGFPIDPIGPYAQRQLARLGCTVQLGHYGGNPIPLTLSANDIAQVPYTTYISNSRNDKGYMTPTCWNDEPAVDKHVNDIVGKCENSRQHGVFVYSLGDEVATTGCCVHPACLAAYRRYLAEQYSDVTALNESWGSDYESFEEVKLLADGDNDEAEALRQGMYPRWHDRQAFKGYNFVNYCERFARRFKKLDPQALTGFEGAGRFADGTDIDLICRTLEFWTPYPGTQDEVLRSIAPRGLIRGNWIGYRKDAESLLAKYWRAITRHADSVWWWQWSGSGTYRGLLTPHMAPWRAIKEMERDTRIVRHGLGTLLLKCERADDGIAILHSYPSTFANKIAAGHSYGKYEAAHTAWHRALRALGLQFSYVTDRMLRRGEFQARRYKMLILPQAEAISPREADVIRDFAANGGCVIADVRPGLYDGHCKAVPQGVLRDLFGVESTGNTKAVRRVARISGDLGGRPVELSFPNAKTDPAVRPTSGRPAGSAGAAPLVIVNPAGRGRAVLLNFRMDSFPAINTDAPTPGAAGFVDALLAMGGVQAKVAITHADGSPVRDTELIRFHGQGVDFLALFGGKDETVQVHLPEPRYVYDLREHASRGRQATFAARKMPNRATFIAISERPLTGPRIRPRSRRVSRGEQLRLRLSYPGSGARHAARLRLFRPDGSHAEWFDRVVITGGDGTRITLPIAYNDPAGRWTIRAIDLYTDEAAEVKVMVR